MTKEERQSELRIIANHMQAVMEDLISYKSRLEETGCKREAKLLDTVAGKLYNCIWYIIDKSK